MEALRGTPSGGICVLAAYQGYGRRTVLRQAIGDDAVVVRLPRRTLQPDEWYRRLAEACAVPVEDVTGLGSALSVLRRPWLVLLGLDPAVHGVVVDDLRALDPDEQGEHRLAITAEQDLRGLLGRQRLDGHLVELDQSALSMTDDEAAALLELRAPSMPDDVRRELLELSDGWAAALVMAADAHESGAVSDPPAWLRSHGAERLLGPWLEALAPVAHEMLLDTAILEQLNPELVEAVAAPGVGGLLWSLAVPRGFVRLATVGLDDRGPWFERHPLLTGTLRLASGARPGEQERHRRAADWFRVRGILGAELEHRLAAGDADTAADRFRSNEDEILGTGLAPVALRWYQALPAGREAAEHLLREAWALAMSGRIAESRAKVHRMRLALRSTQPVESPHPQMRDLEAEADVLDAWLAEQEGDVVRQAGYVVEARRRFGDAWSANSHQLAALLQARAAMFLGDLDGATELLVSLRDLPFATAQIGEGRRAEIEAELAWIRGHVLEARSWAARHDRWLQGEEPRVGPTARGPSVVGALCLAEAGDPGGALVRLRDSARLVEQAGNVTDRVVLVLARGRILGDQLRLAEALSAVAEARSLVEQNSPLGGLGAAVTSTEVRLRLAAGDVVRAERLIKRMGPGRDRQLAQARLALQKGTTRAGVLVREIDPVTPRERVTHGVLMAWAALESSPQRCEQHLVAAADVAGNHGMTTALVDVPQPLLEAARRAASHYVHDALIASVRVAERARESLGEKQGAAPADVPDVPLTRGDLQMLALLPTRATYGRIADELGISVNTVKTRLRRLYAKLGAEDRDDAVARARRLGVIGGRERS